MNDPIHYDIIADVHGRFDKLSALMARMGYQSDGVGFIPPEGHCALFLGDLIDTKPGYSFPGGVRATLHAVKSMCDAGDALCLMGNHEFNAICYHTKGPDHEWLRKRGDGNVRNHKGTLDDFPDYADQDREWLALWVPWMRSLPTYLDLEGFRAVHACWHPDHLGMLPAGCFEDDDFLVASADKHSLAGQAVEIILKGIEVPLPKGAYFIDHQGSKRKNIRVRWWVMPSESVRFDELVFPHRDKLSVESVSQEALQMLVPYPPEAPLIFFGHYFKPADSPLQPEQSNLACLDHSAAKDGPLVAYRWSGETQIQPEHYITSHVN